MATILIIDDDADFIESEKTLLTKAGYAVGKRPNAGGRFRQNQGVKTRLVILDVMMPDGYEGFKVAREIRETLNLRDLPIILLTSLHEKKQVQYRFAPDENYLPVDVFSRQAGQA